MKGVLNLFAGATILLLLVATYMRLAGTVVSSKVRNGRSSTHWHLGYDSADSVFLCALIVGAAWCLLFWMSRQRS